MKRVYLFTVFAVIMLAYLFLIKEGFTSPGTNVQLATSHVPTEEDLYYYKNVYPKEVRREITSMTGGDPGALLSWQGVY